MRNACVPVRRLYSHTSDVRAGWQQWEYSLDEKLKDILILAADDNENGETERELRLFSSIVFRASQVSFVNGAKVDLMSLANVVASAAVLATRCESNQI